MKKRFFPVLLVVALLCSIFTPLCAYGEESEPATAAAVDEYRQAILAADCQVDYLTANDEDGVSVWLHDTWTAYLGELLGVELITEFTVETIEPADQCSPGSFTFTIWAAIVEGEEDYTELFSIEEETTMIGVITAADHSWGYTSNGDGTHDKVCQVCGETVQGEACSYTDNVCGCCGYTLVEAETAEVETPVITGITGGDTIIYKEGRELTLTVEVEEVSSGTLSYQWYQTDSEESTGGTAIAGATGASYILPITEDMTGTTAYYYCQVTNTGADSAGGLTASAVSDTAEVTVLSGSISLYASYDFSDSEEIDVSFEAVSVLEGLGYLDGDTEGGEARNGGVVLITAAYTATAGDTASIWAADASRATLTGIRPIYPYGTEIIERTDSRFSIGDIIVFSKGIYLVLDIDEAGEQATLIWWGSGEMYTLALSTMELTQSDETATVENLSEAVQIGGSCYVQCYRVTWDGTAYTYLYTADGSAAGYYYVSGGVTRACFYEEYAPSGTADIADGVALAGDVFLANTDAGVVRGTVAVALDVYVQAGDERVSLGGVLTLNPASTLSVSGDVYVAHLGDSGIDLGTVAVDGTITIEVNDLSPVVVFTVSDYAVQTKTVELTETEVTPTPEITPE
ncbi:MAG: hypothetical protein LUG57_01875, partial [Oscillospiraceae bacterium]|nr:hypothetical protein [Oscillospiraceae bacterium]